MMKRIDDLQVMAHRIEMHGACHDLSIATISPDREKVSIAPYRQEVHSTPFYNGAVRIEHMPEGYFFFVNAGSRP